MEGAGPAVAGVVVAAGEGRRLGRPKALVDVAGQPLLRLAVDALRGGGCEPVAVVLGAGGAEAEARVPEGTAVVPNAAWAEGMATSVAAGLRWAAATGAAAVVVLPVDVPGVGAAVVGAVVAAWRAAGADGRAALVATYDGAARNPVLLGAGLLAEVAAALRGDEGARRWLAAHPDEVTPVEVGGLGDPTDVDTPEDLARVAGQPPGRTSG